MNGEKALSHRSGNRLGIGAFAACFVIVAGCSGSGTQPATSRDRVADDPTPADIAAADTAPADTAPADTVPVLSAVAETVPLVPPLEVPEEALVAFASAVDAMAGGDWIQAEIELEDLIGEHPAFPGPYVNLAILYRRDGRDDEAQAALQQALALAPGHAAANNELGVIYRERGDFADAEMAYRRAIETEPTYALAHYNLGVLLDIYLKREAEALQHYEAYQALAPVPDQEVGIWILDLRRRLGLPAEPQQVARENGL